MQHNTLKTVIILGSGAATRLKPISNVVPKMLTNAGQKTILLNLLELYDDLGAEAAVVTVNNSYDRSIVESYLESTGKKFDNIKSVKIEIINKTLGTLHAISTLNDRGLLSSQMVFNWSDVIPEFIDFSWYRNAVYTFGSSCRYKATGNVIGQSLSGNVVGVYQFDLTRPLFSSPNTTSLLESYSLGTSNDNVDLADALSNANKFATLFDINTPQLMAYELKNLTDLGDLKKLSDWSKLDVSGIAQPREFNKIDVFPEFVVKYPLNERGASLQDAEIGWYTSIETYASHVIPSFAVINEYKPSVSRKALLISRLEKPFKDFVSTDSIKSAVQTIAELHQQSSCKASPQLYYDIKLEVLKANSRISEVRDIIKAFESKILTTNDKLRVNNLYLAGFSSTLDYIESTDLINKVCDRILHLTKKHPDWEFNKSAIIHGDLNLSNIMFDSDENLKFIDPRGYFGRSWERGLAGYDYAKLMYGLSGYDEFNSCCDWTGLNYEVKCDSAGFNNVNIRTRIKPEKISGIPNQDTHGYTEHDEFITDLHKFFISGLWDNEQEIEVESLDDIEELVELWVSVMWINLSGYFKNNPYKALAAYYHGLSRLVTLMLDSTKPKHSICVDIDDTVTVWNQNRDYKNFEPVAKMVNTINSLYDAGHTITLFTARGMTSCGSDNIDTEILPDLIENLTKIGLKYHELVTKKPSYDIIIDDKAMHPYDFIKLTDNNLCYITALAEKTQKHLTENLK